MRGQGNEPGRAAGLGEKFRGALVGAAVGDALGAAFEGRPSVNPAELARLELEPGPLRYTDDTHMTLGMAQSLVERGGFDGPHMAATFARNFEEEPWRGYGPGPPQVFRILRQGVPWDQAGRALFAGGGSFGNGAAMRVAPVALIAFQDVERVASLARQTAVITHAHDLGVEGAVLQACAVAQALRQDPADGMDRGAFLDALRTHVRGPVYDQKLGQVERLLEPRAGSDREAVVAELGNAIEAFNSVPTAIYAFLRHAESFKEAVTYAISLGGDTDTIASMSGAISGAYLGAGAVPELWRDGVEDSRRLQDLADSLLRLALASGGRR